MQIEIVTYVTPVPWERERDAASAADAMGMQPRGTWCLRNWYKHTIKWQMQCENIARCAPANKKGAWEHVIRFILSWPKHGSAMQRNPRGNLSFWRNFYATSAADAMGMPYQLHHANKLQWVRGPCNQNSLLFLDTVRIIAHTLGEEWA